MSNEETKNSSMQVLNTYFNELQKNFDGRTISIGNKKMLCIMKDKSHAVTRVETDLCVWSMEGTLNQNYIQWTSSVMGKRIG